MSLTDRIGFGAWQLAGPLVVAGANTGWPVIDETAAIQLLHKSRELGVRFFDTSEGYGAGKSEERIGKAFGNDTDLEICSKFGWQMQGDQLHRAMSADRVVTALDDSLRRLQREKLDHYLLHSPRPEDITDELVHALQKQQKAGKIGSIGISVSFLQAFEQHFDQFDSFEFVYNAITEQNLSYLPQLQGRQLFARSVFASGLLLKPAEMLYADRYTDWRNSLPEALFNNVRKYKQQHPDADEIQLLESALKKPFTKVLLGISSVDQLQVLQKL